MLSSNFSQDAMDVFLLVGLHFVYQEQGKDINWVSCGQNVTFAGHMTVGANSKLFCSSARITFATVLRYC